VGKLLTLKTASPPNRAAIIDEFGNLCRLRDEFAPFEKRHGQLYKEIKTWYENEPAEKTFTEKGLRYQLDVGMQAEAKTINMRLAYKILGLEKFLKACTLTLKALGELLGSAEIDCLTTLARTGHRIYIPTLITRPAE
jgi:hypothetical protein